RLAQVLANLLDNARRYTPDGGEITVTVDHAPADAVPEAAELTTTELTTAELTTAEPTGTEPTGTEPTGTEPAETGRAGTEPAAANQPGKRGAPGGGGGESMARVRVADSGPGVPAEDRERIFDRLVRLDDARSHDSGVPGRSGVGLGLAIARGIARAHGGELRCDRDSVFELILPTSGTPVGGTAVGDTAAGLPLPSTNHSADPGQLPVSSG
ncbi:MAG: two-component system, OmpR family, sensor kinase, partial [Pseudonocardiales bacterium]|nr:two-component system, OmpR family, sensor kinase [Pseudonocardiales bacterium]